MEKMINLNEIDAVMFDLDGTVYYGTKIIPGANDTINFFRERGKKVYFTTNNSTKTRSQIFDKLKKMGVDCQLEEIVTSGYLAALYAIKNKLKSIYIFGSNNLIVEFMDLGIKVDQNETAENLLIGYNPEMTYEGLTEALQVALHAKKIIACNRERIFPGENARLMPGCGAMTAPIEWCADRKCDVIIGKPNTTMVDIIASINNIDNNRILIVGDTYESDIVMAQNARALSIFISKDINAHSYTVESIIDVPNFIE